MNSDESNATTSTDKAPKTFLDSVNRRRFLKSSAGVGAAMILTQKKSLGAPAEKKLKVALIGVGRQGETLMNAARNIPDYEFTAVCDIIDGPRNKHASGLQEGGRHTATPYADIDDLLNAEASKLDAVMIAVPDIHHAPYTVKCLEAGLDVYCEKMMSNTIQGAADMVNASNRTKKLLQIGHQRRSNPRYISMRARILQGNEILGRITHCRGQWNRGMKASAPIGSRIRKKHMPTLEKYGYKTPFQFTNWRNFREFGGGPISDLGAHQIDMLGWMLTDPNSKTADGIPNTVEPTSLVASGGLDFWTPDQEIFWGDEETTVGEAFKDFDYDHYDNVMTIYEFPTPKGVVRGYYQVLTTTSSEAYYEVFMGDEGTARISEAPSVGQIYRESSAPAWDKFVRAKNPPMVRKPGDEKVWENENSWKRPNTYTKLSEYQKVADARASAPLEEYWIENSLGSKALHQPHIENFFDAVRKQDKTILNCPGEEAFKTAVAVISANTAIAEGKMINFKPEDFLASTYANKATTQL